MPQQTKRSRSGGWDEMYALARDYARENGTLLVPGDYEVAGRRLGAWIGTQRYDCKAGSNPFFTPERKAKLDAIGMVWDVREHRFQYMCNRLRAYIVDYGDARVPQSYVTPEGDKLGVWLNRVRMSEKAGKLSGAQRAQLEELGVIWNPETLRRSVWDVRYAQAMAYRKENGAFPPADYVTPEGDRLGLGLWLANQRGLAHTGRLLPERRALLSAAGLVWEPAQALWQARYEQAKEYFLAHGHLNFYRARSGKAPDGLAQWLGSQRKLREKGRLEEEKIAALEAVGMVWDVRAAQWEEMYQRAKVFYTQNGHLRVAKRPGVREDLGTWLSTQRRNYILGTNPLFTDECRHRLEEIGMVWDAATDSAALWEEWYGKAAAYYRQHGHLCPEKGPLRTWVLAQRAAKKGKRGSLSEQQIRRLEAVGMQWDPQEEQWLSMYRRAQAYYEVHRMLNVPCGYITEDGARLGQWVARQRAAYRNFLAGRRGGGRCVMTARHAALLNRLEMIWDGDRVTAHTSFREKALLFYLRKAFLDAGKVTRRQRFGVELDIYLPSVRTAIEYDGCRWHADRLRQDEEKAAVCLGLGIRLIRIREPGLPAVTQCGRTVVLEDLSDTAFERAVSGLLAELGVEQTDVNLARDGRDILAQYRDVTARAWDRNYKKLYRYCAQQGALSGPDGVFRGAGRMTAWVNEQREAYRRGELTALQIEKLEGLGLCWAPFEARWRHMYGLAAAYAEEHGGLNIPAGYCAPGGERLGQWLARQRGQYRKNQLSPRRVNELERLGILWEPGRTRQEGFLEAARRFREETGHLDVPAGYVTKDGLALGAWLREQKRRHGQGLLSEKQVAALEALGVAWRKAADRWEEMFRLAAEYSEAHGNLWVPPGYVSPDGVRLGGWVAEQRGRLTGKGGHSVLTSAQKERLDAIGMVWDPYEERWMSKYRLARAFYEANGHLNVPSGYVTPDGVKLGMWIGSQRQAKQGNPNFLMTSRREALLNAIGMNWTLRRTKPDARKRQ